MYTYCNHNLVTIIQKNFSFYRNYLWIHDLQNLIDQNSKISWKGGSFLLQPSKFTEVYFVISLRIQYNLLVPKANLTYRFTLSSYISFNYLQ